MPTTTRSTKTTPKQPRRRAGPSPARYDFVLVMVVATLIGLGMVMIFSASYVQANNLYGKSAFYFLRQLQWLAVSVIVMVAAALLDFRILKRLALLLMAGTVLMLIAVLLFGSESLGSKRHLFGTSVQPSEVAKLTIIIYIAYWLSSKGNRLKEVSVGLVPFSVLLSLVALLIVLQPDFDTTALIVLTGLIMFFIAGADLKQLGIAGVVAIITFIVVVTQIEYASIRINEFIQFLKDPGTGSAQLTASLQALANGGVLGAGLGDGTTIILLPFTDSIFAVIGEELGLVGALGVVALFVAFAYRGLRISLQAGDSFGLILGCGITGWIALQAFINIAVNTATLPFSGLTLPFVSYGGSSLVACMAGVGVLLSISRYGTQAATSPARATAVPPNNGATYATLGLWWRNWRARLPGSGRARRVTTSRQTSRTGRGRTSSGNYSVKASSAPRTAALSRRVTRTKRTIARRTGAGRKPASGSSSRSKSTSGTRQVPRRR
ncbi:MAG: putative peptidoglycan glycosyltransferase FtsW [Caldilineales bacterium]